MRFFSTHGIRSFARSFWKVPGVERCIAAGPVSTPVGQRQGGLGGVTMGGTTRKIGGDLICKGHDEPIHESCAIYFPGGTDESTLLADPEKLFQSRFWSSLGGDAGRPAYTAD